MDPNTDTPPVDVAPPPPPLEVPAMDPPAPEIVAEAPPAPTPPAPEPSKELPAWALKRMTDESERARVASERATAAERRAQEAEALASRLRAPNDPPVPPPEPRRAPPLAPGEHSPEVLAAAQQLRLGEQVASLRAKGLAQFGEGFERSVQTLVALGAATPDFVSDVLAVDPDQAHVIFSNLAKDAEKTVYLKDLPQNRRIAELTRMSVALNAAKDTPAPAAPATPPRGTPTAAPTRVSQAPAPAPRVTPSSPKPEVDWRSDANTDEELFTKEWQKMVESRAGRRR